MKKSEGGVRRDLLQFHPTDHRSMIIMIGQLIICLGQLSIFRDKCQSYFPSDAWKVARLYHTKVQQKLDSGVTDWLQMNEQWGASTLPHELMAANAEAGYQPKKASKPRVDDSTGKGAAGGKSKDDKLKRLCPSWNTSETRGKCGFELEHEGLNCKYTHHCTYCKSKKLNPVNHQRHFCKRRLEDEEE